jgi:hypothetical protein
MGGRATIGPTERHVRVVPFLFVHLSSLLAHVAGSSGHGTAVHPENRASVGIINSGR